MCFSVISVVFLLAQNDLPSGFNPQPRGIDGLRIMFYNVENLFDTKDDSLKRDEEFLPDGDRRWNEYRFWKKINHISSVIVSVGGWEPPGVIGLCEVENLNVLKALFYGSGLKRYDYDIVHFESPDVRGIDVALAFRPQKLTLLHKQAIPVYLGKLSSRPTRDILYAKFRTLSKDTLHVFVNHWSSRWGGEEATRHKRIKAAKTLCHYTDSLSNLYTEQNIVIMGDFNDGPDNESIYSVLNARDTSHGTYLINLMATFNQNKTGTHFYKETTGAEWHILDQLIISKPLIENNNLKTCPKAHIFNAGFLMTKENGIKKPYRTFLGFKYIGGYSDHLPVYMDIFNDISNSE